jgi:hypothetical protein
VESVFSSNNFLDRKHQWCISLNQIGVPMYRPQYEDDRDDEDLFEIDEKAQRAQKFARKQKYRKNFKQNRRERCPGCRGRNCFECPEY